MMLFDCHKSGRCLVSNMKPMLGLFVLCLVSVTHGEGEGTQVYNTGKVILKPPKLTENSTLLVTSTEIFILWLPPDVYPLHKVSLNFTSDNERYAAKMNVTTNNEATTENSNDLDVTTEFPGESSSETPDKGDNSTPSSVNPTQKVPVKPKCMSESQFKNIDPLEVLVKSIGTVVNFVSDTDSKAGTTKRNNNTLIQVDFDKGCVEKYTVNYVKVGSDDVVQREVSPEVIEYNITNLTPSTAYVIFISASFTSGHILTSNNLTVTTKKNSTELEKPDIACHCSYFGKKENTTCRTGSFPWCQCKPQYTGAFCEVCRPGYYRSAPYFPCNRCPCSPLATISPTCHYREGYLVCNRCKPRYTGHLCQSCINGYYRYHGQCYPCHCNLRSDPSAPRICDPYTGACTKCLYNTTGFNCELCKPGYVQDNPTDKNCVLENESKAAMRKRGPSKGLIAGICIAVILALCAVVGFAVYRRWKVFPPRKPFWTVELKEDHDGVNFSAVPGQEYVQHDAADFQDLEFYEKHRGKNSGKSVSSYAQLKEEI